MRTLKLSIAVAALTLTSLLSFAQPPAGHPGKHGKHEKHEKGDKIVEKLGLSPEQAKQFKTINDKQKAENKALQDKMAPLKKELKSLKAEKKALNEVNMKEIESLLTPEQLVKFNEMKEQRKEKGKKEGKKK